MLNEVDGRATSVSLSLVASVTILLMVLSCAQLFIKKKFPVGPYVVLFDSSNKISYAGHLFVSKSLLYVCMGFI